MKSKRHQRILEIVESKSVETQEELAEELGRAGFEVTQATVSRDIKELRLVKIPTGKNTYKYGVPADAVVQRDMERMERIFRDSVLRLDYSENIVVIKTMPGAAQGVASTIDHAKDASILGTVAGDDTIFVVIKPIQDVRRIVEKFTLLMNGGV